MADDRLPTDLVRQHIERCVELYGLPLEANFAEPLPVASYEQMRADLMMALGMLMAVYQVGTSKAVSS